MAKTHRKHRGGVGEPLTVNTGAQMANGAPIEPTIGNSGKKGFNFGPNLTVNPGEPKAPEAPTEPTLGNSGKNKFNFGPNTTGGKRKKSKTGGANPLEWFQGIFNNNKNKALTSASNVQTERPVLEIPEPEPQPNLEIPKPSQNMKEGMPFRLNNVKNNTTPIVNTTSIVKPPMVNKTFNNQAGGKRRKSKTRKHKKNHKRR